MLGGDVRSGDAGRHAVRHAVSRLAIQPDRALDRARPVPAGISLHAADQTGRARDVKQQGERASRRSCRNRSQRRGWSRSMAREDFEERRLDRESHAAMDLTLRARGVKATLNAAGRPHRRGRDLRRSVVRRPSGARRPADGRGAAGVRDVSRQDLQADEEPLEDGRHVDQGGGRVRADRRSSSTTRAAFAICRARGRPGRSRAGSCCRTCDSAITPTTACCGTSRLTSSRASGRRWSDRPAPASRRSSR